MTFNKHCSLNYKNETKSPDNVKCSSFIPLRYHYFLTQIPRILITSSHLGMNLKFPLTTETGLLHLQTIHSHIHFLIIVECNVM